MKEELIDEIKRLIDQYGIAESTYQIDQILNICGIAYMHGKIDGVDDYYERIKKI